LVQGLVPSDKRVRVYNYQRHTVEAFAELLGGAGLSHPSEISRHHVNRRTSSESIRSYASLFPYTERGSLLKPDGAGRYQIDLEKASPHQFAPQAMPIRKAI
jgi:hypothetical protein